jgi:lysophospholipase L1-like esterase
MRIKRTIPDRPIHKLVALGDSLVQGFRDGAISDPAFSFPLLLAKALHPSVRFDQAHFPEYGGLPLNLDVIIRSLESVVGDSMEPGEWHKAVLHVMRHINLTRRFWSKLPVPDANGHLTPFHNQSVWGAGISDTWVLSGEAAQREMLQNRPRLAVLGLLPDHAQYITAQRVLNPSALPERQLWSMIDNVRWFADNGGIENLVVWIGSNNIVGAVTSLNVRFASPGDAGRMPGRRRGTVTPPEEFQRLYRRLAEELSGMKIKNIFAATLPDVTKVPLLAAPGLSLNASQKYASEQLTHPWLIQDGIILPGVPFLTKDDISVLQKTIGAYNRIIGETNDAFGIQTVPASRWIDALPGIAVPNNKRLFPEALARALTNSPNTAHLVTNDGTPMLTTSYPQRNAEGKLIQGGIFSLDALHPTVTGYALIAHLFRLVMKKSGVLFEAELPWGQIISSDQLLQNPPHLLSDLNSVLRIFSAGLLPVIRAAGASRLRDLLRHFA